MVAPLSSRLVLTVNPRVTFRWSARSVEVDSRTRAATGSSEESVGLSTLRAEERTLLALADGRRTIEDLAQLAGMTTSVAAGYLRALCDRGILISDEASLTSSTSDSAGELSTNMPASPEMADAELSDPVEYDYSDSMEGQKESPVDVVARQSASGGDGSVAGGSLPDRRTEVAPPPDLIRVTLDGLQGEAHTSSGNPSEPAATQPATSPVTPAPATSPQSEGHQPRKSGSGPNATLWWVPRPSPARETGDESAPSDAQSGDSASPPRARPNSPEATVVVFGSTPSEPASAVRPAAAPPSSTLDSTVEPLSSNTGAPPASAAAVTSTFRVGAYEVAIRIAQGAMGSIYVCRRTGAGAFQRLYTLKVVRQHASQTEVAVKSFAREARIGGMLNHPNLQVLVDVGAYQNQPFLILDYIEGTSLGELLIDERRPPPGVVVAIMLDLLRGLQYVHAITDQEGRRLGLVHADISPQNVLVGVDGSARLTDFGSARHAHDDDAGDADPGTIGKPAFMAPEQLLGQSLDSRTDIFSVGAVMWTALTGQSLFAGETYDQTVMKVLKRKIPPPSEFGGPPSLDAIVLKALSRSPEGRYTNAEEMARELLDAAAADRLVASASEVGQWVRREFGELLADRRRKIQEVFGAGPRAQDAPIKVQVPRPHRVTPRTVDGFEKMPTKTVQLDAMSIAQAREVMAASAAGASAVRRAARPRGPDRASRSQWILVIMAAVFAAGALGLAIAYFVSSLNAPPKREFRRQPVGESEVRGADPALPASGPVPVPAVAPRADSP